MPLPLLPLLGVPVLAKLAAFIGVSGAAGLAATAAGTTTTIATTAAIASTAGLAVGGVAAAGIAKHLHNKSKEKETLVKPEHSLQHEEKIIHQRNQQHLESVSKRDAANDNAINTTQKNINELQHIGAIYCDTTNKLDEIVTNIEHLISEKLSPQINEQLAQFKDFLEHLKQQKNDMLSIQEKFALLQQLLEAQVNMNKKLTNLLIELSQEHAELKETNEQQQKVHDKLKNINALQKSINEQLELINAQHMEEINVLEDKIKFHDKGHVGFFKPTSIQNTTDLNASSQLSFTR